MNADLHDTEPASTRELSIFTDTRDATTTPKQPDQNNHDQNNNNDQKPDHEHDDNHRADTRSNKTKSKTHTHASRSCGAFAGPGGPARNCFLTRLSRSTSVSRRTP